MSKGNSRKQHSKSLNDNVDMDNLNGLSPAEREAFSKGMFLAPAGGFKVTEKSEKDQTVSKLKYETDISELKETIRKKDEKIADANNDRDALRKERDGYKTQLDAANASLESEKRKNQSLIAEKNDLADKVKKQDAVIKDLEKAAPVVDNSDADRKELKKAQKAIEKLEADIRSLENDISGLKADVAGKDATILSLRETISKHDEETKRLDDIIESKNNELEALRASPDTPDVPDESVFGTLIRKDAVTLYSELFEDGRYDVRLARDGSYMMFARNVEGLAVCQDHSIRLPRLASLIPYSKQAEYPLIDAGNSVLRAQIRS